MRDGKRMQADIYRPKDESKKYPIIFVRTPYNFNYWDVENAVPRDMTDILMAIKRGYAFVYMQERGDVVHATVRADDHRSTQSRRIRPGPRIQARV